MTMGTAFWVLMLIWLIFGSFPLWKGTLNPSFSWTTIGGGILLFVLLALLGWHEFGPPIHG